MSLSERQERELLYHRTHALQNLDLIGRPADEEVVRSRKRRWWNPYWHLYSLLQKKQLSGRRVFVPGCGFGEDALQLSLTGAHVFASDLSPESIEIAKKRASTLGYENVSFEVSSVEHSPYPDRSFDLILLVDILHHVDIEPAMVELMRVIKPGGEVIGLEMYTHSALQRVRRSRLVEGAVYQRMVQRIYGTSKPYITPDEHKIDERELALISRHLRNVRVDYFNTVVGRVIGDRSPVVAKVDRVLTRAVGRAGALLAGRLVFTGFAPEG